MAKYSEQQINNIYLRCNAAPMEQLLQLCLDPESGITIDGLRAVHYNKIEQLEQYIIIKHSLNDAQRKTEWWENF